jgi:CheY-like chemotaxis protein
MRMPEMDGLAATRAIRAMGGRLAAVPIIALTANAFPEDVAACSEAGMTGFLAKPVTKQALLTALLAVFDPVPLADPVAPPAAASGGAEPAIDREGLAQLTEDIGADGVSELTAMFAAETRARLDQIADGALDPEALIRAMHSLKGTAASACAVALSRRAAALEIQLKQGIAIAPADVSALREAFDAWCGAVQEIEVREAMHV